MNGLTITQHRDCAEHAALLERMGLRRKHPDRIHVHARTIVPELRCPVCDGLFRRQPTQPGRRYCSTACKRWADRGRRR